MNNNIHPDATIPSVPTNPWQPATPEWYYDEAMRFIEPDLMLNAIGRLEAFYTGETEQERQQRFVRYEQAFAVFDEAIGSAGAEMEGKLRILRNEKNAQALRQQEQQDAQAMSGIAEQFDTSPDDHVA